MKDCKSNEAEQENSRKPEADSPCSELSKNDEAFAEESDHCPNNGCGGGDKKSLATRLRPLAEAVKSKIPHSQDQAQTMGAAECGADFADSAADVPTVNCDGDRAVNENRVQADATTADDANLLFRLKSKAASFADWGQRAKNHLRFSASTAEKLNKAKRYLLAAAGVVAFAVAAYGAFNGVDYLLHGKKAYAITVDNQQVATVDSYHLAKSVVNDYLDGSYTQTKIKDARYLAEVEITKVYNAEDSVLDYDEAQDRLAAAADTVAQCVCIMADGKVLAYLADEAEAERALQLLKDRYIPDDSTLTVTDVKFKEQVEITEARAAVDQIVTAKTASETMQQETTTVNQTYTVQAGETIEDICESQGVAVSEMAKGSNDVDFEDLQSGDLLIINKEQMPINVLTVMEKTKSEIISYEISYQENNEMPAGTQNVVQEGFDGEETVNLKIVRINGEELYRERLSSQVNIEPTTKIVDCGTKVYNSYGGNSSGYIAAGDITINSINQMIWPTNATAISSPYGMRSRGWHTGLDINGEMGDPIWAALDGTVTTAGWCGNYGNCIVLDHGNGLSTRYAHLSAINVGVGQTVHQGQTIGLEGSTGNSTGSHLHFEIIIGGSCVDPLLYISR